MRGRWLLAGLLVHPLLAAPANLLAEPGFEAPGTRGVAAGWSAFPIRGKCRGELGQAGAAQARSGRGAQRLTVRETMDGWLQASAPIDGGVVAGHDYQARIWLRGDRRLSEAALVVHDNTAWFPRDHARRGEAVGFVWQEVVLQFRAATTDPQARLGVLLAQEGTLWADDASLTELLPGDRPAPKAGNWLVNGSFEAGLAGWVGHWLRPSAVADDAAPHGEEALALPTGAPGRELQSGAVSGPWGGPVTLSAWFRSQQPVATKLSLHGPQGAIAARECAVTSQWTRFDLTTDLPPSIDGRYHVTIAPGPAAVWVDAVQLECSKAATDFQPRAELEADLLLESPSQARELGDPLPGTLVVYNAGVTTRTLDLTLEVSDLWDRVVARQPCLLNAPPGRCQEVLRLDPPEGLTGHFRAAVLPLQAETTFGVLPPAPTQPDLPLGTHVDYNDNLLPRRAGAGWTKSWHLSWGRHEPQPGTRVWPQEDRFKRWHEAGLQPLAVLSEAPPWAQDRPSTGLLGWGWYRCRDAAAMAAYAHRIVERYGDLVGAWELQNEPNAALHPAAGSNSPADYAADAVALARGVRAADPKATIVLGSVTLQDDPELYLERVFAAQPDLRTLANVVSYHNYSADPAVTARLASRLRAKLAALGLSQPIWDTEWSPVSAALPRRQHLAKHHGKATARRVAAQVVQGFVARLGEGVANSFLYHAYGSPQIGHSDFDLIYEVDGQPSAVPVAQAVLARQLSGTTPLGRADGPAGCWAYDFRRDRGPVLRIAWALDQQSEPRPLPDGWLAVDMMGNPLPPTAVLGDEPVYLTPRS